jgi:hypothetical protein
MTWFLSFNSAVTHTLWPTNQRPGLWTQIGLLMYDLSGFHQKPKDFSLTVFFHPYIFLFHHVYRVWVGSNIGNFCASKCYTNLAISFVEDGKTMVPAQGHSWGLLLKSWAQSVMSYIRPIKSEFCCLIKMKMNWPIDTTEKRWTGWGTGHIKN